MTANGKLDRIRDDFAADQGRLHTLMAHRNAVGDGDRVKPAGHTPALLDTLAGDIRLRIKCCVAWRTIIACRNDAHERTRDFLRGQTHGIIIASVRRALWPYRDMTARQFRFVKLMRHFELLIQARLYGFCSPKPSFSET